MSEAKDEYGQILVYKNEDGKAVVEFEGLVTSNVPLDTESQHFAGAINELAKKLQQGGGGDEPTEDWQPPADWLAVPEPAENEIYLLIDVIDENTDTVKFTRNPFRHPVWGQTGVGEISVDWGDGLAETFSGYGFDEETGDISGDSEWWSGFTHTYSQTGQYLLKVTTEIGKNNVFSNYERKNYYDNSSNTLICKIGSGVVPVYNGYFGNLMFGARFEYFKYLGVMTELPNSFGTDWRGVVKIEFAAPVEAINTNVLPGAYAFSVFDTSQIKTIGNSSLNNMWSFPLNFPECTAIGNSCFLNLAAKKLSSPKCQSIGDNSFTNCYVLEEIDLPQCKSIGRNAFGSCYNLKKINVHADCVIDPTAFANSYKIAIYNK